MTNSEDKLWKQVTESVTPLKDRPTPAPLPPRKRFVKNAEGQNLPKDWGKNTTPPANTIDKNTQRKLTKGNLSIDRTLDLHDHTQDRAYDRLKHALVEGVSSGAKCILVITGKGGAERKSLDSGGASSRTRMDFALGTGTLKRMVPLWLNSADLAPMVHSYDWAHKMHGGEGALYVLLRRKRKAKRV